jgi:toxin YoeB
MKMAWDERAWADYLHWRQVDAKMLKRINTLLNEISRGAERGDPHHGIGRPEALRFGLHGFWSRRITAEHRLIYQVVGDEVFVVACRHHYES